MNNKTSKHLAIEDELKKAEKIERNNYISSSFWFHAAILFVITFGSYYMHPDYFDGLTMMMLLGLVPCTTTWMIMNKNEYHKIQEFIFLYNRNEHNDSDAIRLLSKYVPLKNNTTRLIKLFMIIIFLVESVATIVINILLFRAGEYHQNPLISVTYSVMEVVLLFALYYTIHCLGQE